MNDMTGDEKDNDVNADAGEDEKKKPDLDDTLSRLLRTQADVDAEEAGDAEE